MKTATVGALKPSDAITEIRPINVVTVSSYRQHMRAGAQFPPIVVTPKLEIVSGHHRHAAYLAEYGENHAIEVEVQKFDTTADMIEFAIQQNVAHGLPLDGISRKRAIFKLTELGRTKEQLATLFGVSVKRVELLAGEGVVIRGTMQPVKAGLEHMHGRKVAEKAYEAHIARDMGMPAYRQAEQLTRWLDNGWVDWTDERNVEAIEKLKAAIENALVPA